jgi:hypothetical protein
MDFVRWNLSKKGKTMSSADAFVVSFPKSGRTWLRVFYSSYLSNLLGAEFTLDCAEFAHFPQLTFTHDRWEHRFVPGWWDFIRGRRLIPVSARKQKPIVLLARDPRDVVVSLYFHLAKRPHVFRWKPQTISEMVRCPKFGIATVIEIMNQWIAEWHGRENLCLLRYEDLIAGDEAFQTFLEFLGFNPIDQSVFQAALQFSRFDNMHDFEARRLFKSDMLAPGDPEDPNSFKVRRGKAGGFVDYLTEGDIRYVNAQMQKLDHRFNYDPLPSRIVPAYCA